PLRQIRPRFLLYSPDRRIRAGQLAGIGEDTGIPGCDVATRKYLWPRDQPRKSIASGPAPRKCRDDRGSRILRKMRAGISSTSLRNAKAKRWLRSSGFLEGYSSS